jgi:hypothetical protein
VHGKTTGIHELIRDSSRFELGGSHHLPPYNIFCDSPWGLHPNGVFFGTPKLGISGKK